MLLAIRDRESLVRRTAIRLMARRTPALFVDAFRSECTIPTPDVRGARGDARTWRDRHE